MLPPPQYRSIFQTAKPYEAYVATGNDKQQLDWSAKDAAITLTQPQRTLIAGFVRRVNILCISGVWCGDCSAQCPMLRHIAAANPQRIDLRFVDRDAHKDLGDAHLICSGNRVPTVIFLNEDFDFISILGDKTLTRMRGTAARKLGAACPLPGAPVPAEELAATLQDWINELERVHLLARLSTKLRAKHHD